MPIDFHAAANGRTYAGRDAHAGWREAMAGLVDVRGLRVVDVGCGGGTYTRAWADLGAAEVVGVDFSEPMLAAARQDAAGLERVRFVSGDATATGLPGACADVVFSRAVVHHLDDLPAAMAEARRLLVEDGLLLVQDRTPEDVEQPGSVRHPRGLVLERFPRLIDLERGRRPSGEAVVGALGEAGLRDVRTRELWEVRREHPDREAFVAEIEARQGRSLLHELDDGELADLAAHLRASLPTGPLVEADRWTVWTAVAPGSTAAAG